MSNGDQTVLGIAALIATAALGVIAMATSGIAVSLVRIATCLEAGQ